MILINTVNMFFCNFNHNKILIQFDNWQKVTSTPVDRP